MTGRDNVILICDVCQQTKVDLGEHSLAGLTEAERFPAMAKAAASRSWLIRMRDGRWQSLCPACADKETTTERNLPSYSGTSCKCPMCHGRPVQARFEVVCEQKRMRRTCGCCGYVWSEATAKQPWWKFW